MDGVVAVEVELDEGGKRYFLTWGRIQAVVAAAQSALLYFVTRNTSRSVASPCVGAVLAFV
jgi:predicted Co/Zn/Cd cation transporter (cation efflux family)